MGNIASACADEPSIEPDSNDLPVAGTRTGGARIEKHRPVSKKHQPSDAASGAPAAAPASRDAAGSPSGPVASHAHTRLTAGEPVRDPSTGGILSALEDDFYVSGGAGSIIGEGAFGIVRKVKHARSKRLYAIKSVRVEGGSDGGSNPNTAENASGVSEADALLKSKQPCVLADVIDEIKLSISLAENPHVVNVYDFYQSASEVHIVMEYLRGGSLLDAINEANESAPNVAKPPFSERDAAFAARALLGALEHLHARNVAHRDVKLENVMFAVRGDWRTLRLVDFGLAMRGKTSRDKMSAQCGSPGYIAPEIVHGKHYTAAVDVWAAGCVFFATLNGALPFEDPDVLKIYRRIADGAHAPFLPGVSAAAKALCLRMLDRDETSRLTASEAKEHEWVLTHVHGAEAASGDGKSPDQKVVHDKSRAARFVAAKRAAFFNTTAAETETTRFDGDTSTTPPSFWRFGTMDLNAGDVLITRGARAKEVFVIDFGCVEILVRDDARDEEIKVAERGVGDVVGEMGITTEAGGDVDEAKYDERERVVTRPSKTPSGRSVIAANAGARSDSQEKDGERVFRAFATLATLLRVKRTWFGARRGAEVRAMTRTRVTVMTNAQYRRMLAEDYGVDVERKRMLEKRAEETAHTVRRASLDLARPAAEAVVVSAS